MSRHGLIEDVLSEVEVRVSDNDQYAPTILLWVRDSRGKEIEAHLFPEAVDELIASLQAGRAEQQRILDSEARLDAANER